MSVLWDSCWCLCPLEVRGESCVDTESSSAEPMEGFLQMEKWDLGSFVVF